MGSCSFLYKGKYNNRVVVDAVRHGIWIGIFVGKQGHKKGLSDIGSYVYILNCLIAAAQAQFTYFNSVNDKKTSLKLIGVVCKSKGP